MKIIVFIFLALCVGWSFTCAYFAMGRNNQAALGVNIIAGFMALRLTFEQYHDIIKDARKK